MAQRIATAIERERKGLPTVDPLVNPDFKQQQQIAKGLGLKWEGSKLVNLRTGK
jgi:hypothetical protein